MRKEQTGKRDRRRDRPIKEIAEVIGEKEATVESWLEAAGQ